MTIAMLKSFFLWCFIINTAGLTVWAVMFMVAGDWIFRLHSRWFSMPRETFNAIHYSGMAIYKLGIFLFNLVPYLALLIVSS